MMSSGLAKRNVVSFIVGVVFAVGLAMSGMTQPEKILGFLNPWAWDPALLFVMVGAIGVHFIAYPLAKKRASPVLDTKWHIPTRKDISLRLILGSALFGIGWGLGGFCPGPGLVSLASGDPRAFLFVGAMVAGMIIFKTTEPHLKLRD